MPTFREMCSRLMWVSSHETGLARCSSQSTTTQKTTSKTLSSVTQDPSTNMFTPTSSTIGNHGEINGTDVIPSENPSNANVSSRWVNYFLLSVSFRVNEQFVSRRNHFDCSFYN